MSCLWQHHRVGFELLCWSWKIACCAPMRPGEPDGLVLRVQFETEFAIEGDGLLLGGFDEQAGALVLLQTGSGRGGRAKVSEPKPRPRTSGRSITPST